MKNFDSMELNATPHAPENPEAVRINGARPESRSFDNGWAQQRANAQAERSLYQDSEYIARTCRDCGKEFLLGREEMVLVPRYGNAPPLPRLPGPQQDRPAGLPRYGEGLWPAGSWPPPRL